MNWLEDPHVVGFETATVDPAAFGHREHLYVAFCYLRALPLEEAVPRYVHHLKALTHAFGVPHKYHATLTWGFLVLLHDLMREPELAGVDFETLLQRRPSLLDTRAGLLREYYDDVELHSDRARNRFILPSRQLTAAR